MTRTKRANIAPDDLLSLWRDVLDQINERLAESNPADNTRKAYTGWAKRFFHWAGNRGKVPAEATRDLASRFLLEYQLDEKKRKRIKDSTWMHAAIGLNTTLKMMHELKIIDEQKPLEKMGRRPKVNNDWSRLKEQVEAIRKSTAQRLELEKLKEASGDKKARLYAVLIQRTIIEVLCGTAMRGNELCRLHKSQLERKEGKITGATLVRKNNKTDTIDFSPEAIEALNNWFEFRDKCSDDIAYAKKHSRSQYWCNSGYVFPANSGKEGNESPLDYSGFWDHVKEASITAGYPVVHPHTFRHATATELAERVPVPALQRYLGHASLHTTSQYVHAGRVNPWEVKHKL